MIPVIARVVARLAFSESFPACAQAGASSGPFIGSTDAALMNPVRKRPAPLPCAREPSWFENPTNPAMNYFSVVIV
jgi:hypothetical protein